VCENVPVAPITDSNLKSTATAVDLPLADQPRERSDAARNRQRILVAAERLMAERGAENVSMDAIAAEACVGKGTLFRRFGDRAGLAFALLDERSRAFQDELIRGAPPLGPGAPPRQRLLAFGEGMADFLEAHGELILVAETSAPGRRFASPAHAFNQTHLMALLDEADPELDAEYAANVLLAPFAAEAFLHMRRGRGMDLSRIRAGYRSLVERLVSD
jgi:AcrR family transcriptional regulator